jgi:transposase
MLPTRFAGARMKRFVEGVDRGQSTLFPAVLDDYVGEDNPVRAIDVFVDGLDLAKLGFDGVRPLAMGRPAYHPATQLKIYIYGYLASSRADASSGSASAMSSWSG